MRPLDKVSTLSSGTKRNIGIGGLPIPMKNWMPKIVTQKRTYAVLYK